jgi:AhpD family alkylhydroperoxidase
VAVVSHWQEFVDNQQKVSLQLHAYFEQLGVELDWFDLIKIALRLNQNPLTPITDWPQSFNDQHIQEFKGLVKLVKMLNLYFSSAEALGTIQQPSHLRYNSLRSSLFGEQEARIVALVLSVHNHCSPCVRSHSKRLSQLGFTQVDLLIRYAATIEDS